MSENNTHENIKIRTQYSVKNEGIITERGLNLQLTSHAHEPAKGKPTNFRCR